MMLQHIEIPSEQIPQLRRLLERLCTTSKPGSFTGLHSWSRIYLNRQEDGELSISTPLMEDKNIHFTIRPDGSLRR